MWTKRECLFDGWCAFGAGTINANEQIFGQLIANTARNTENVEIRINRHRDRIFIVNELIGRVFGILVACRTINDEVTICVLGKTENTNLELLRWRHKGFCAKRSHVALSELETNRCPDIPAKSMRNRAH